MQGAVVELSHKIQGELEELADPVWEVQEALMVRLQQLQ
jgi:hypothetical protein